jgi:hypothetical protein
VTNNQQKLLDIVRKHYNQERAIEVALKTMLEFLEQDGSSQEQPLVCPRESA